MLILLVCNILCDFSSHSWWRQPGIVQIPILQIDMVYQKQDISFLHHSVVFILLVCLHAYGKNMLKEACGDRWETEVTVMIQSDVFSLSLSLGPLFSHLQAALSFTQKTSCDN